MASIVLVGNILKEPTQISTYKMKLDLMNHSWFLLKQFFGRLTEFCKTEKWLLESIGPKGIGLAVNTPNRCLIKLIWYLKNIFEIIKIVFGRRPKFPFYQALYIYATFYTVFCKCYRWETSFVYRCPMHVQSLVFWDFASLLK